MDAILKQFNFVVVNTEATRETLITARTIDLVIANNPKLVMETSTLETGTSDHKLIQSAIHLGRQNKHIPKLIATRAYKRMNAL